MSKIDYAMFVRIVAVVFSISAVTAFSNALLRLLSPGIYYKQELSGKVLALHYILCALSILTSVIGFVNSSVVMFRSAARNVGRRITVWLLLDSVFETTRVIHLFVSEALLPSTGPTQLYEMIIGGVQYLIDSLLYCQVVLMKQ